MWKHEKKKETRVDLGGVYKKADVNIEGYFLGKERIKVFLKNGKFLEFKPTSIENYLFMQEVMEKLVEANKTEESKNVV